MTNNAQMEELHRQRGARAKQLQLAGQKVIGYFCCFVPDEIITAFDMVPYRIQGSQKASRSTRQMPILKRWLAFRPELLQPCAQRGL